MFMTLNHRLFLATGDSKYIDVLERGMYNNALGGVSASGDRFFYVNRLASAGDGRDLRWERASLECCPPNLVRFLASMPGYIYAQDQKGAIYVNLYVSSEASFTVGRPETGAVGAERDAVGRQVDDRPCRGGRTVSGAIKLRDSRLGAQPGRCPAACTPTPIAPRAADRVAVNGRRVSPRRRIAWATSRSIACGRPATSIEVEFPFEVAARSSPTRR